MDLCLMIEGQEGVTWPQWLALAQACEQHAVPALFRSDHYLNLDGQHPERGSLDAWTTLGALAAVTSTLRLGTLVSPATFRHPSLLAKSVATVDEISGGRVELGLGAGWHQREHDAYGFEFQSTRVRVDVLEEQLQIVLGAWAEGPFSFDGAHYKLHDLDAQPKPVQKPHPPLIMGGSAGPRSAALAARFADEYNTPFPSLSQVSERKAVIDQACEKAGRLAMPFSIMTAVVSGADQADLRERVTRYAQRMGADADALLADPPHGWVLGTLDEAAEQLAALREAGVSRVMCQHLAHDDLEYLALLEEKARSQALTRLTARPERMLPVAMVTARVSKSVDAPPERVLELLRDYEARPKILTDNYSSFQVQDGTDGGKVLAFHFAAGGRERDYRLRAEESDTVQRERDELSSFVNTWTVAPAGAGSSVTLEGSWQGAGGIGGIFEGLFAPIGLRRIYGQVLDRLAAAVTG